MIVCRTFTLLFMVSITACGVCSSLFPLFRRHYDYVATPDSGDSLSIDSPAAAPYRRTETVYYWYKETVTEGSYPSLQFSREYNDARRCDADKLFFVISSALSTAGAGLGGLATLMAAAWVYAGFDSCLHSFIVFVTFLAFACYTATAALVSYVYTNGACKGRTMETTALRSTSPAFALAEGFIFMCVAAGGMLVAVLLAALAFCVCTDPDDYCGGGGSGASRYSSSRSIDSGASLSRVPSSRSMGSSRSIPMSARGTVYAAKPQSSLSRNGSTLSRSRGEVSMARRSSSASLSRQNSASSMSSRSIGSSQSSLHSGRSGSYRRY